MSSPAMGQFQLLRLVAFGTVLTFALVPLGIAANFLALGADDFTFPALTVAVSVITIVTLTPILIIDFTRKGSPTSWTMVELGWCGLLWILWLAAAAHPAATVILTGPCDVAGASSFARSICNQFRALEAFSWLIWLILMAYITLLAAMASIHYSRGNRTIWQTSTADYNFFAPGSQIPTAAAMQQYPQQPQPQQFAQPQQFTQPQQFAQPQQQIVQPQQYQPQPVLPTPHPYAGPAAVSPQVTGTTSQPGGYTGGAIV